MWTKRASYEDQNPSYEFKLTEDYTVHLEFAVKVRFFNVVKLVGARCLW